MRKPATWVKGIGLVFGLSLLGWIINDAIDQSQSVAWPPIPVTSVIIAFTMVLFARFLHAVAWVAGAREVSSRIEWVTGIAAYNVAFLGRYIPGKIWQVGGLVYLARHRGADALTLGVFSVAFLVAYQLIGGLMLLIATMSQEMRLAPLIVVFGTVVIVLILIWVWYRYREHIIRFLPSKLAQYTHVLQKQPTYAAAIWGTLLVATWGLLATSGYVLIDGFLPTWDGTWGQSATAVLGGIMVGFMVFIAPSGVGVREGMMLILLEAVGITSISAFMIVVSHRLIMLAAELFWAVIGIVVLFLSPSSEPKA